MSDQDRLFEMQPIVRQEIALSGGAQTVLDQAALERLSLGRVAILLVRASVSAKGHRATQRGVVERITLAPIAVVLEPDVTQQDLDELLREAEEPEEEDEDDDDA